MPSLSPTHIRFTSPPNHTIPRAQQPQPPPEPCPWLWRCHQCHIPYRLSTTRRCLECDHQFCLLGSNSSRKRKRGSGQSCRAEFDYAGWAARGAWRRTVLLNNSNNKPDNNKPDNNKPDNNKPDNNTPDNNKPDNNKPDNNKEESGGVLSPGRRWLSASALSTAWGDEHRAAGSQRFAAKRDALFVRRRHDCWVHCDFPSQCHHALYTAQKAGRPTLARAAAADERYLAERARMVREGDGRRLLPSRQRGLVSVMEEDEDESSSSGSGSGSDSDGAGDDVSPCSSPPPEIVSPDSSEAGSDEEPPTSDDARHPVSPSTTTHPIPIPAASDGRLASARRRRQHNAKRAAWSSPVVPENYTSFDALCGWDDDSDSGADDAGVKQEKLDGAYSEQGWFPHNQDERKKKSRRASSRQVKSERMLALIGRRTGAARQDPEEAWEAGDCPSDSSASSPESSAAAEGEVPPYLSLPGPGAVSVALIDPLLVDVDVDGDSLIPDAEPVVCIDEDRTGPCINSCNGSSERDLIALVKMKNAFMRGDLG